MRDYSYPVAAHDIVDVLATSTSGVTDASTEAELVVRDERSPLVVLQLVAEAVTEDQSTNCTKT